MSSVLSKSEDAALSNGRANWGSLLGITPVEMPARRSCDRPVNGRPSAFLDPFA
jgi:hypothetical protein